MNRESKREKEKNRKTHGAGGIKNDFGKIG